MKDGKGKRDKRKGRNNRKMNEREEMVMVWKKVRDKVAEKRGRKKFKGNMGGSKIVAVHVSSGK